MIKILLIRGTLEITLCAAGTSYRKHGDYEVASYAYDMKTPHRMFAPTECVIA